MELFKLCENKEDALGIREDENENLIFETDEIDDNLLENFWRTKDNLVELIAAEILKKANEERRRLTNEYDEPNEKKITRRYLYVGNDDGTFSKYTDYECMTNILLGYSFEGYYIAPIIKAIYLKNRSNKIGEYFAPLMYYVGEFEGKSSKINGNFYEPNVGELETIRYEEKKGLFGAASVFYKIRLYDFYSDLVKKIEDLESEKTNPFFIQQRIVDDDERNWNLIGIKNMEYDGTLFSEIKISFKCKKDALEKHLSKKIRLSLILCAKD